ncbi:MAG: MFS transporter [Asgard group archaeon]|nr:MFS transporter [Asgard group archaeon]
MNDKCYFGCKLVNQQDAARESLSEEKQKSVWFTFEKNEILLLVSYFLFGVAFANYEPYAPLWLNQIFAEESFLIIGFVAIIPSLITALGTPGWGFLADKFGTKKFVIIGYVSFALMFLSLIIIQMYTQSTIFFLIAILVGFLFGSAQASNFAALSTRSINKPREVVLAKNSIVVSIAFVIFSPLVGWIIDKFGDQAMVYQLIIATGAIAIAIIILFFVREVKEIKKVEEFQQDTKSKVVLTTVPFIFIGLMVLIFNFQSGGGFWAYTSIYFLDELAVPGKMFSIFLIAKTALAIPVSYLLGLVKSQKRMGIIIISFLGYFTLVYTLMTIFPMNWILLIVLSFIPMYPIYNVFFYTLTDMYSNEKRRATAFGILSTVGTIGYITGILLLGVFADRFVDGIFVMFPVTLVLNAIGFVVAVLLYLFIFRKDKIIKDTQNNLESTK